VPSAELVVRQDHAFRPVCLFMASWNLTLLQTIFHTLILRDVRPPPCWCLSKRPSWRCWPLPHFMKYTPRYMRASPNVGAHRRRHRRVIGSGAGGLGAQEDAPEAQRLVACARLFRFMSECCPSYGFCIVAERVAIGRPPVQHSTRERVLGCPAAILIPTQQNADVQVAPNRGLHFKPANASDC